MCACRTVNNGTEEGGEPWSSIGVKAAALGTPPAVGGGTLVPASPFGGPSQKVGVLLTL